MKENNLVQSVTPVFNSIRSAILMELTPVSLERDGDSGLLIHWSNGAVSRYTATRLRAACPCATCREKNSSTADDATSGLNSLPILSIAEAAPLRIERMQPVGNYAYNIAFSDGHDSGIFTFDLLHELSLDGAQ